MADSWDTEYTDEHIDEERTKILRRRQPSQPSASTPENLDNSTTINAPPLAQALPPLPPLRVHPPFVRALQPPLHLWLLSKLLSLLYVVVSNINMYIFHPMVPTLAAVSDRGEIVDPLTKQKYSWPNWFVFVYVVAPYVACVCSIIIGGWYTWSYISQYNTSAARVYLVVQTHQTLPPRDAPYFVHSFANAPSIYDAAAARERKRVANDRSNNADGEPYTDFVDTNNDHLDDRMYSDDVRAYSDEVVSGLFAGASDAQNDAPFAEAPPAIAPAKLVCEDFRQWEPAHRRTVRRPGCYDLIHLLLDLQYNPAARTHTLDKIEASIPETDYAARKNIQAAKQRIADYEARIARQREGKFEPTCMCSAHFGIFNSWAWIGWEQYNTTLLIDPQIVPLQAGKDDAAINTARKQMLESRPKFSAQYMSDADQALLQSLRTIAYVSQPAAGIRVTYKTIPAASVLKSYYQQYGPTEQAFTHARAMVRQNLQTYEKGSSIFAYFNRRAHQQRTTPEFMRATAHEMLVDSRYETAMNYAVLKKNTSTSEALASAQRWLQEQLGYGNSGTQQIPSIEPELIEMRDVFIPAPHSSCVIHCITMQRALLDERRDWYNYVTKRIPELPQTPRRYAFSFLPSLDQPQTQKRV